jgi:hypothetical protein
VGDLNASLLEILENPGRNLHFTLFKQGGLLLLQFLHSYRRNLRLEYLASLSFHDDLTCQVGCCIGIFVLFLLYGGDAVRECVNLI